MNILDKIIAQKRKEVETSRLKVPLKTLERSPWMDRATLSLSACLQQPGTNGIIAEFKRMSPSRGILNGHASVDRIASGYVQAGASALSVLTDWQYFGGSSTDLMRAREQVVVPILRKDFIIDEYQVVESKALGADTILLIAGTSPPNKLDALATVAHQCGLEVILEVHDAAEIEVSEEVSCDLIGVNNRNLVDFKVSVDVSRSLAARLPGSLPAIAESGIENPDVINELRRLGYSGFLIGSYFMQHEAPERACHHFIQQLQR